MTQVKFIHRSLSHSFGLRQSLSLLQQSIHLYITFEIKTFAMPFAVPFVGCPVDSRGKLTTNRAETKATPDDTELCEIWDIADKETEFYGSLNRNKNLPPIDR